MTLLKSFLLSAVLIFLFAGCAGTDFTRPSAGAFQLGKSTTADLLKVMGPPRQTNDLVKNSAEIKQLTYVYATTIGSEPLHPGVTPARVMTFSTFNDILVGEQFISSFKVDGTDFDSSKVAAIVKGKTTKAEVIAALGAPSGEAIYPIVNDKENTAIIYAYTQTTGSAFNLKFYHKVLTVSFDRNNVVSDVEFAEAGSK
jgi:outer membrane protein assembly factor BamE (lipoprotein component of BamABCDE complex)